MSRIASHGKRNFIDEFGHFDISLGQSPTVMSRQRDLHLIVNIEPLRVMVHLLSLKSHAGHETKRLVECFEV